MKLMLTLVALAVFAAGCGTSTPTPTVVPTGTPIPFETLPPLPTLTPFPLDDPELLELKELLKEAFEQQNSDLLRQTISFSKWAASIYRVGGTPVIDPPRGLTLSMQFAKENKIIVDPLRPTHEPRWSVPLGETSELILVLPEGDEPYHAHLFIQREPGAWRYTGLLTRIPYYDPPTIAQVRADPPRYEAREFMYVGTYQGNENPPADAGPAPGPDAFILQTFAGPVWVLLRDDPYVLPLDADAETRVGQLMRVYGVVTIVDGQPYLLSDSVEFIAPDSWAHVKGTVQNVGAATLRVRLNPEGGGTRTLQLTETTFISQPDGSRGAIAALEPGVIVDATGVPQPDGGLLVEELYISR
jgi:hypothetical protein